MFNIQFYLGTSILVTLCLPCLLFSRDVVMVVNRIWCLIMIKGMKWWLGTDIKVIGKLPSKDKVVIYAIKHQSAWETVFCTDLFAMPSIVLKKALIYLPVIGLYFLRSGAIPITRDQGINALKKMGRNAKKAVNENRSMMIFPQGTRVNPGITPEEKPYLPGVFFLYNQTKVPVIPVAHNAGLLWPKNSFMKYPDRLKTKKVTIKILPAINPGMSKIEFLKKLESDIESNSNELIELEK
jgi:1-acyl-sn-glycerol-3-phosphate acyltransferase